MKRLFQICSSLLLCIVLFGCAHPISMVADSSALKVGASAPIDKKVGYSISDAAKKLEVTTPGGGGDKIRYFPYRDLEPALYQALSVTFADVTKIKDPKDLETIKAAGVSLLITPEIATSSSSESAFTWPPTKFSVTLICTVTDVNGQVLDTLRVEGNGQAEFSEFSRNFSLAAVRASNEVIAKLVQALRDSKAVRE